jgi:putative FmdB family regulatory protein
MPTYDYKCEACGKKLEIFQKMSDKPLKTCPACNQDSLKRLIGSGAGIIFNGKGFYCTDYRSDSYKNSSDKDKTSSAAPEKSVPAASVADKKTE